MWAPGGRTLVYFVYTWIPHGHNAWPTADFQFLLESLNFPQRKPWTSQSAEAESRSLELPPHIQSLTLGCGHNQNSRGKIFWDCRMTDADTAVGEQSPTPAAAEAAKCRPQGAEVIEEAPLLVDPEALSPPRWLPLLPILPHSWHCIPHSARESLTLQVQNAPVRRSQPPRGGRWGRDHLRSPCPE